MVGDFGRFFALPLYKVTHWLIMSTIIDIPKFTRSSKNMAPTMELKKMALYSNLAKMAPPMNLF